uniref:Transport and Golgi organization protein 1 n=1 Tax=Lygus hesperus TaxID=30085 RepID=A0A0A9WFF4_LYGHE
MLPLLGDHSLPFGNDPKEPETQKSGNQENNSSESITTDPQTSLEAGDKPEEANTESTQAASEDETSVAQNVISEQPEEQQVISEQPVTDHNLSNVSTDTAHKPSDPIVEQSSKDDGLDDKPSEIEDPNLQKNLSDPGVPVTSDSGPIIPLSRLSEEPAHNKLANPVDSDNKSDPESPTPHNDASEEETKPVNQLVADIQPTDQSKTMGKSEELSPETLPSNAGSTDPAEISQNNQVESEQLPTQPDRSEVSDREVVDEISADSEEDSNINIQSPMTEDHSGNEDHSVMSQVPSESETGDSVNATVDPGITEVPARASFSFSSNLEFVDPRVSDPAVPSTSPVIDIPVVTEVPKIEPEPTDIPPITQTDESVPHVDEPITAPPPPEPEIVDEAVTIQSEVYPEPPLVQEDSSDSWYSGIFSAFSMFSSHEAETEVIPSTAGTPEVTPKFQEDEKSETCSTETCDGQPQISLGMEKEENYLAFDQVWLSPRGMILLIITAAAVLLFSLGHYYLENLKRDVELVSKYNDLAGKLFIEQKEKEMLTEQLASVNESMTQISFDTTKYDEEISDLKSLVQKYKEEKSSIEEKEKETRKKFMMVDKNYNELRNMLSQNKQKGERSALILDIKNLKESIAGNNIEIASLKEQLIEKKEEIKSLNARIVEFMDTQKELEQNVEKAISENHETAHKYQDNIAKLEKTIEESTAARVKLEKECTQLKKERESLAIEKELAESSLQKFQRLKPSTDALSEWLDAKEVRVSLLAAEKKVEELAMIRDDLIRENSLLEEKQSTLIFDFEQLNEKYEKAEKDKIEALTKLQVLSDYFKEKESQLQEELGTRESLWLQKQSDDRTIYEQMRALREENTSFKNQNETLKREILDQEASFKKLITSAEEKAHENWVALRHQERRLKEAQMEASQLRSRLTALEATGDNSDDKMNKGEVNGDIPSYGSATSPPFMMYPEFVPPPPLLTTTPSRPPPLGRISSPPLGDFTPPPPLVPYEMFLPPSPPPPAPHVLHKPQPLDGSHRIQKDSQSSNHSNESAPDRPRRNKR